MKNNRYTFWKLLDENIIEIPIIQRDYAQGRADEKRIRDKFLDALCEVIKDEKKSINLDFVYGEIKGEGENKKLTPLDGQQRLTTLFLLHWYLATKENKFDEASKKLQKFTYETRVSSREFCKALATNKIDFSKENEKISNIIEDKNWFFKSWKKDPTIKSMLNMLDAIHEKFKNSNDLFYKLICENNPPITFDFLPLNKFNLTDELYIKMNARGKPLTHFENFKSNFVELLDFETASKLDNEWTDLFWSFKGDEPNKDGYYYIDDKFLNFFTNCTLNFYLEENNLQQKIDEMDIFDIFNDTYKNKNNIERITKLLDSLCNIIKSDNELCQYKEYFEIFIGYKEEIENEDELKLSYWHRMRFYAISLFLIEYKNINESNINLFKKWLRVTFNLINNELIQSPELFAKAIRGIKELSGNINDIDSFISNCDKLVGFNDTQIKEESLKAKLILENQNWEEEIIKAECHWYLDGQIGFLLEFSDKKLEKFIEYRDKFINLWCLAKDDKKQNLIQRALLVKSDYTALNSRNYLDKYSLLSFGTGLREKNENWRRVFKDKLFKAFLDNLDFNNIENSLKEIINSFKFDCTDWRSFIINPNKEWHILDGIKKGHFLKKDNNIFLNAAKTDATSWGWSKVAELKNYYTYAYFKNNGFEEVVEEKLKQEIKLEYYASSEPKDVCFYFIINYDKKDLGINIEFDTEKNKYIFDIFYRNPYKELQRLCLEFELCKDKLLNNLKDIQEEIVEKLDNILFT
ncbi:DUF262 domain-containing protein [Aliarcobacter cryaerophilus]|uniref:DUF262 domain-containing protein n=2 Tax=unclassified Arcobacter TaxID=2593671 RepID=A0AA96DBJ0_9BACT|nr:DUF262 domain-containing protein [Arcobacter sp. AZ-2023]WPD09797.1 DUF262 domain-containing protein [Arcobacter sp. DSM 115954]WNL14628.1 DUF262 domain-containing protein [Arcobacter sp. AZ-2023]WNL19489.1 DUF262 domain-containing protein [Arcobacter sp. AZ-2023]WNL21628.1 DUF262 domain-containing protein [Arcobacter sp. AZ-2023]